MSSRFGTTRTHARLGRKSLAVAVVAFSLGACGVNSADQPTQLVAHVVEDPQLPDGSAMADIAESGAITIGITYDRPGLGERADETSEPTGFEPQLGAMIAGQLGISSADIAWVETIAENREAFLTNGTVDVVVAAYSMTEERAEVVGQAGPYIETGQGLLVADRSEIDSFDDLDDATVCTVAGSTSLENLGELTLSPVVFNSVSECVNQLTFETVDAVTSDELILRGFAAEKPDELRVVGEVIGVESYGIGYRREDSDWCQALTSWLEQWFADGSWGAAFDRWVGDTNTQTPSPPQLHECGGEGVNTDS